jgi:(2Fe-2S) ferredoxin/cyclopropane fatty-acyl-phospholipid synthase-like methyltransferase
MEPFRYHVYMCNQHKAEGIPSCTAHGSEKLINILRAEVMKNGLGDTVQITTCGSLGVCDRGPNMVVYPEGTWYSGLTAADIPEIVDQHFKSGKIVERLVNKDAAALKSEINTNKNKMISAMKAKDAAGILPDDLMQEIAGFRSSRIVLSAVELDIFTAVGKNADAAEIAKTLQLDPRATESFLNALVALGLLEKKQVRYYNTPVSSRYLMEGSPDDSRASIMHSVHLWDRWSTLTECIREGTSVTYKDAADRKDDWTVPFIAAMHKNAGARTQVVVRAIGLENVHKVLDVGGGSGAYSIAFAKQNTNLQAEIFDLPTVIPIAHKHIDDAGIADRVKTRAGDFRKDDLGSGYDLVFISAICHMNSPDGNVDLLSKAYKALVAGGRVVIQDFILNDNKTGPKTAALFALNMLVGTRAGSSYSEHEYSDWLAEVGFKNMELMKLPGPTDLIAAYQE